MLLHRSPSSHFSLNSEKQRAAERCKSTLSEYAKVQRLRRWLSLIIPIWRPPPSAYEPSLEEPGGTTQNQLLNKQKRLNKQALEHPGVNLLVTSTTLQLLPWNLNFQDDMTCDTSMMIWHSKRSQFSASALSLSLSSLTLRKGAHTHIHNSWNPDSSHARLEHNQS